MHTLSPAAMAAIRTLMAELDAAAAATKRNVSVTLSADFAGDDGNYAVNASRDARAERYRHDVEVWRLTTLEIGRPLTPANLHAVTPGVVVEVTRHESVPHRATFTHHITKRTEPDVWDMSIWIKETTSDGRYRFNTHPVTARLLPTSEVMRMNPIVCGIPVGPRPQPRWEDYR